MFKWTLKELLGGFLTVLFIGFFIGVFLFGVVISVAAVFSSGIIASETEALLLAACCWFIGSVVALLAIVTNSFGLYK